MVIEHVALADTEMLVAQRRLVDAKSIIGLLPRARTSRASIPASRRANSRVRSERGDRFRSGHRHPASRAASASECDHEPDPLSALLAEHEMWLTVERGLAANSLAAYRRDLRRYEQFLRPRASTIRAVAEATVSEYVEYLGRLPVADGERAPAPASIARGLVAVRSFHRFCASEGLLDTDPSEQVGAPRAAGDPEGARRARDRRDPALGRRRRTRERSAIAPSSRCCTRPVCASASWSGSTSPTSISTTASRVLGKGDKERVVPMGRAARSELRTYCADGRLALRSPRPTARRRRGVPQRARRPAHPPGVLADRARG